MSLSLHLIQVTDSEEILDYEMIKLSSQFPDLTERSVESWTKPWRKESLDHYLALGWSFMIRESSEPSTWSKEGALKGYFLAQPLLFFHLQTQSLWVEHLTCESPEGYSQICEFVYRLGREKHLQKIYFPQQNETQEILKKWNGASWDSHAIQVKTTRAL